MLRLTMRGAIRSQSKQLLQRQHLVRWVSTTTPRSVSSLSNFSGTHRIPSETCHDKTRPRTRDFSTTDNSDMRPDIAFILEHYRIHRREKEGSQGSSREYLLLPPDVYVPQVLQDPTLPAAAVFAHRNVLFGARSFHGYEMEDVCLPLVRAAIEEAEAIEQGQQPQAVASLKGLSEWVAGCLDTNDSSVLQSLDEASLEAVRAIATGIPRPGHSVVGQGTFRDGQAAWEKLGKEYVSLGLSKEANLYEKEGGKLVNIEHLADQSPDNMQSAGGAMARLFFL